MNVAGSRAPAGKPKILTREDFEKSKQATSQQNSATPSPPTGQNGSKANASGKSKPKNRRRKPSSKKKNDAGFKVIVRLLPPNLKAEDFWSKVNDFVNAQNVLDKYYVQGKYSNKPFKLPNYSRAYIQFKESQVVDQFVAKYKEVTFEDDKESLIPTFAMALFSKMPENENPGPKPASKPKQSLEDLLSYKNFLKFYNGEMERPQSFLVTEKNDKKAEKKAAKKAEKKGDQPAKNAEKKKKKDKKDAKKDEKKDDKPAKEGKKEPKKSDKPKDAKKSSPAAANPKKETTAEGEEKKKKRVRNKKKKEGEQQDNGSKDKAQPKAEAKPKNQNKEKPKPKPKAQEKKQQNNGGNAQRDTNAKPVQAKSTPAKPAQAKPKIQLLSRDNKSDQDQPKKPTLLKRDS